ncbi:MAG: gephyrin-like molybdotransferase Glp [Bacteroidota bacterium]
MIPVSQALAHAIHNLPLQPVETIPLTQAPGRTLATHLASPLDHPLFDQSAVDGYAFRFADLATHASLRQVAEVRAGSTAQVSIGPGECTRIFTGAAVPVTADTVIMQEYTSVQGPEVTLADERLKIGGNIRRRGEQIEEGAVALRTGETINPATIGFLASLGIKKVTVRKPVRVAILVTGDEFAASSDDLKRGKIFESNGQMLQSALTRAGITAEFRMVPDDFPATVSLVEIAAEKNDLLLITGGVSVGKYDFTRPALEDNGFGIVFHKVNQKPGKPLLYARRGDQAAFGLPGNPRSVLVAFYHYVLPHLDTRLGKVAIGRPQLALPLAHDYRKKDDGKAHFVTGTIKAGRAAISPGLGSHMLQSFARATILIHLPGDQSTYTAGTSVTVELLPQ